MRILLDECLPKRLKRDLIGHEARVPEMGWAGKQNGDLLALAAPEFDIFLTVDRNLSFQQRIMGAPRLAANVRPEAADPDVTLGQEILDKLDGWANQLVAPAVPLLATPEGNDGIRLEFRQQIPESVPPPWLSDYTGLGSNAEFSSIDPFGSWG